MKSDSQFIKRLQRRDKQAFAELYKDTTDQLYRYMAGRYSLPKQEMFDIISDFYVKLRRVLDKFDPTYKFETFFWTVFKNMLKDHFKKKTEQHDSLLVREVRTTDPDALLKSIQGSFQLDAIKEAMQSLDESSYQIIIMKYVEQLDYDEIADLLQVRQDAVRKRLSRALLKIKQILG